MIIPFKPASTEKIPASVERPKKLRDLIREHIKARHYSLRTEETYWFWIKRYILFHGKRHPVQMGATEIKTFLTDLALSKKVSARTQNQAFNALIFLYKQILKIDPGQLRD